jgi:hypothetical protein
MTIEVTLSENEIAQAVVQYLREKKFTCSQEKIKFDFAVGDDGKQIISAVANVGQRDAF